MTAAQHVLYTFHGHEQWVQGVAFAHTKLMIATGCDDKYVRVFEHSADAHSLAEGWTMKCELGRLDDDVHAHTLSALTVAFDPLDDFVVSGSADTSVKLWRVHDKECAHDMLGHEDWVSKVVRHRLRLTEAFRLCLLNQAPHFCCRPTPPMV